MNNKQNIRYVGFECGTKGDRRLTFSIDEAGTDHQEIRFDIAAMFFAGKQRILVQEAAGICYSKLKDLVGNEVTTPPQFNLTEDDIVHYRQTKSK